MLFLTVLANDMEIKSSTLVVPIFINWQVFKIYRCHFRCEVDLKRKSLSLGEKGLMSKQVSELELCGHRVPMFEISVATRDPMCGFPVAIRDPMFEIAVATG